MAAAIGLWWHLGCASEHRAPELAGGPFCDQDRGWTGDELADLAFRYAGYKTPPAKATVRYWQQGCEITVHVSLNERIAGAYFQVLISAKDGSLILVVPGE
jgi:hypothetical protein